MYVYVYVYVYVYAGYVHDVARVHGDVASVAARWTEVELGSVDAGE